MSSGPVFVIVRKEARSAVAMIHDLVAVCLQLCGEPSSAKCHRSLFAPRGECRGAGRRANQGNLLRLTDDFDRQGLAPYVVFPGYRARVPMAGWCNARAWKSLRSCSAFPCRVLQTANF